EIVRDAARQFTDRLHFLRHGKLLTRFNQLLLCVASLGCVADDAGKAEKIGIVVADRGEDPSHEEGRAIFPDPPTFHFVSVLLNGQLQCTIWHAGAPLVRPVKDAEMFADDFLRRITDYLLGGTVPTGHVTGRIKDKNCVIRNALEKDLKSAFGAFEYRLRLFKIELGAAQLRQ